MPSTATNPLAALREAVAIRDDQLPAAMDDITALRQLTVSYGGVGNATDLVDALRDLADAIGDPSTATDVVAAGRDVLRRLGVAEGTVTGARDWTAVARLMADNTAPAGPTHLWFTDSADAGAVYSMPKDGSAIPTEFFDEGAGVIRQFWVSRALGYIYYAVYGAGGANEGIRRRSLADPAGSATTLKGSLALAWGCRGNEAASHLYYSTGNNVIGRINLPNGGGRADIYTGVSNPAGLDHDPIGGRLYAANQGTGRVTRGTPSGAARVDYNAASGTNFDFVTHGAPYIFAGGNESGGNLFRRYGEAFGASDGSETSILGALVVSGAVWDVVTSRVIYGDAGVIKTCLADGTGIQTLRDVNPQLAGVPFNLALA